MTDDPKQPSDADILYRVPPSRPSDDDIATALRVLVDTIPLDGDIPGAVELVSVRPTKDQLDTLREVLTHYLGSAEK